MTVSAHKTFIKMTFYQKHFLNWHFIDIFCWHFPMKLFLEFSFFELAYSQCHIKTVFKMTFVQIRFIHIKFISNGIFKLSFFQWLSFDWNFKTVFKCHSSKKIIQIMFFYVAFFQIAFWQIAFWQIAFCQMVLFQMAFA